MSDYGGYAPQYGSPNGCLWPMLTLIACILGLVVIFSGGDGGGGTTTTTTRTNTEVLSRNHALSDNETHLFSDNTVCLGDYSCSTFVTQTVVTVGDSNNVQAGGGLAVCWDKNLGTYTSSACLAGGQP